MAALASLLMTAAIPTRDATASDRGGRIELTTTATLYGVGLGVWSSMEGDLKPRPAAWLTAALGGGMLYGSYKLTDHLQLNTANVRYIEAAGAWTAVNGVLVASMTDTYGSYMVAVGFGTAAAGAGMALATYPYVGASAGQMSLVNSGGIWGPAAGLLLGITFHLGDGKHLARDLMILNLLGLGGAVALSQRYDPTRDQVLYLDGGLLLGGLCGGLVGTLFAVSVDSYEPATAGVLLGMGVGGLLAIRSNGFDRAKSGGRATERAEQALAIVPLAAGSF